jgi:hypothetical protein
MEKAQLRVPQGTEIRSQELRDFISVKDSTSLDGFRFLSDWEIAENLPYFIRRDFLSAMKGFDAASMYMHHGLYERALKASCSGKIDYEFLREMTLDHQIVRGHAAFEIGELNSMLQGCVAEVSEPYSEEMARFMLLSALRGAMKGVDREVFKKPWPSELPPRYHMAFAEVRAAFLKERKDFSVNEAMHRVALDKSLKWSFMNAKKEVIRDEILRGETSLKSLRQILISFSAKMDSAEWRPVLLTVCFNALKLLFEDNLVLAVFMHLLKSADDSVVARMTDFPVFPGFWSSRFCSVFKENKALHPLLHLVHPSFYIEIVDHLPEGQAPLNVLIKKIKQICDNDTEECITIDAPYLGRELPMPLVPSEKLFSILPSVSPDKAFIMRAVSGLLYRFVVTRNAIMEREMSLLSLLVNSRLRKYAGTKKRGLFLACENSVNIGNGFLSRTDLVEVRKSWQPLDLAKNSMKWHCLFGERLGAVSALQILLKAKMKLGDKGFFLDLGNAVVAVRDLETSLNEEVKLRLVPLLHPVLLRGVFVNGIVSAFLCFSLYERQISTYLRVCGKSMDISGSISEFSIADRDAEGVSESLEALIGRAWSSGGFDSGRIEWI